MRNADETLYRRLKAYLSRTVRSPEDVEDLVQESFLKVLEAASKGEIHYRKTYIYRTAKNLAINSRFRKSNTMTDSLEDFDDLSVLSHTRGPEQEVGSQEQFELFCLAVKELPRQCRRVFVLRKVYGYSHKEIAKKLGISVNTVEKHIAKGMLRCANYMNPNNPAFRE